MDVAREIKTSQLTTFSLAVQSEAFKQATRSINRLRRDVNCSLRARNTNVALQFFFAPIRFILARTMIEHSTGRPI
jgi:hypothetical protein